MCSQIKHLEEHLKTHSDTIERLEENQSVLKSVSFKPKIKQSLFNNFNSKRRFLNAFGPRNSNINRNSTVEWATDQKNVFKA